MIQEITKKKFINKKKLLKNTINSLFIRRNIRNT